MKRCLKAFDRYVLERQAVRGPCVHGFQRAGPAYSRSTCMGVFKGCFSGPNLGTSQ